MNSGVMYQHLIDTMDGKHPSRASVIFFLNALVDNEYLSYSDATGKGGHHRTYYTTLSKDELMMKISSDINKSLVSAINTLFN